MNIKSIIESLLFINEKPLSLNELYSVLENVEKKEIEQAIEELKNEYLQRSSGICIVNVAGGYQMCSSPENEQWVKKMYREKNKHKLSRAALETLAIIAYKQPITKVEIEAIRGVNTDGVIKNLLDFGLIKVGGRKEVVGRPFVYITTRKFLEYFGLNSLKDLPTLEEFVGHQQSQIAEEDVNNNLEDSPVGEIDKDVEEKADKIEVEKGKKLTVLSEEVEK